MSKIKNFFWLLMVSTYQIFQVDYIRFLVVYARFIYFYKIRKMFFTFYPMDYKSKDMPGCKKENLSTVEYNAAYIKEKNFFEIFNQFSGYRSQRLVGFLACCFSIPANLRNKKCLSIGPRTEAEIFSLLSYGAKFKDIFAVDIQSYSPKIKTADACDLPFDDNSFDCVVAGWVLPYIVNKQKAAEEIVRVLKDDGVVALSHSWYPKNDKYNNGDFSDGDSISNNSELLAYFSKNTKHIIVDYDQSKINDNEHGDIISVLKVSKK